MDRIVAFLSTVRLGSVSRKVGEVSDILNGQAITEMTISIAILLATFMFITLFAALPYRTFKAHQHSELDSGTPVDELLNISESQESESQILLKKYQTAIERNTKTLESLRFSMDRSYQYMKVGGFSFLVLAFIAVGLIFESVEVVLLTYLAILGVLIFFMYYFLKSSKGDVIKVDRYLDASWITFVAVMGTRLSITSTVPDWVDIIVLLLLSISLISAIVGIVTSTLSGLVELLIRAIILIVLHVLAGMVVLPVLSYQSSYTQMVNSYFINSTAYQALIVVVLFVLLFLVGIILSLKLAYHISTSYTVRELQDVMVQSSFRQLSAHIRWHLKNEILVDMGRSEASKLDLQESLE